LFHRDLPWIPLARPSIACCRPSGDLTAAKLFLRLTLSETGGIRPRVINVDGHPAYASAIAELKRSGELSRRCRCRQSPYFDNVIEQDHLFIKKRIAASFTSSQPNPR
jgi:transposase-like protein